MSKRLQLGALLFLLFASIHLSAQPASAEYRLQPGDVLELFVAGVPNLNQKAAINLDGDVVLPVLGRLKAQGLTLGELQEGLHERVSSKTISSLSGDGMTTVYLDPAQVTINVAEYRPVYIRGDVTTPGAQPFRPGLTVRQAVAVAGGYDIMRFRFENPFMQSAELRGEYNGLWIELARAQIRILRLEAELDGSNTFEGDALNDVPISPELLQQVIEAETNQLDTRLAALRKDKDHMATAIATSEEISSILSDQQKKEKEDMDADGEDLARVQGLFDKGTVSIQRITEARQALLSSSVRYLDTTAELGAQRQTLETARRELDKVESDHRLELWDELQKAKVELATAHTELGAVSEKLLYVGTGRSDLLRGLAGEPKITIFSDGDPGDGRAAEEQELLAPGDVIEVRLEPPPGLSQLME